jgi:hypothetical protein
VKSQDERAGAANQDSAAAASQTADGDASARSGDDSEKAAAGARLCAPRKQRPPVVSANGADPARFGKQVALSHEKRVCDIYWYYV